MKTIIIDGVEYNLTPKVAFREGDWVVDGNFVTQITGIEDDGYTNSDQGFISFETAKNFHLWTIKNDAKDGDVLVANIHHWEIGGNVENFPVRVPTIFIYQKVKTDKENIHAYVSLYNGNSLVLSNSMYYNTFVYNIQPATKKQRDTLFAKMQEAGYEWDSEMKELKLLITNGGDFDSKNCEQKSAWSEEDEHRIKDTVYFLDTAKKHYASTVELDACIDWLKSLKGRVQPIHEYSDTEKQQMFIKSYMPHSWKPSEGQLECLGYAIEKAEKDYSPLFNNRIYLTLKALKEQLEKL